MSTSSSQPTLRRQETKLGDGVKENLDAIIGHVTRFFDETKVYTPHFVHWWQLREELSEFFFHGECRGPMEEDACESTCLYKFVSESKELNTSLLEPLNAKLEEAEGLWSTIAQVGQLDGPTNSLADRSMDLRQLEKDIYFEMDSMLAELTRKEHKRDRHLTRPFKLAPGDPTDMDEMIFFWFRFFGLRWQEISLERFSNALRSFLQLEPYYDSRVSKETFDQVMHNVIDADDSGRIDPNEWYDFGLCYGPMGSCYENAKAACTSNGELSPWFCHYQRAEAHAYIRNKEKDTAWHPSFVVRAGKNSLQHAFSISYLHKGKMNDVKVKITVDEDGERWLCPMLAGGKSDKTGKTVRELAIWLVKALKLEDDQRNILKEMADWEEQKIESMMSVKLDKSTQTQYLKVFFGISDDIIKPIKTLSEEDEKEITDMLAQENSLDVLRKYSQAALDESENGLDHVEKRRRRENLQHYLPKTLQLTLAHIVVDRACEDERWIQVFGLMAKCGVSFTKQSAMAESRTPLQHAIKSGNVAVVEALLELIGDQIDQRTLFSTFEEAVRSYSKEMVNLLLTNPHIDMASALTNPETSRSILHAIAELTVDDDDDEVNDDVDLAEQERVITEIIDTIILTLFPNATQELYRLRSLRAQNSEEKSRPGDMKADTLVDFIERELVDETAAVIAAKRGNKVVLMKLRELGARLDLTDKEDKTILHHIVQTRLVEQFSIDELKALFSGEGSLKPKVNSRDVNNKSPLFELLIMHETQKMDNVQAHLESFILFLLEMGASVASMTGHDRESERAINRLAQVVFRSMLESDIQRWAILRHAIVNGDDRLVELILRPPLDVDVLPYMINPYFRAEAGEDELLEVQRNPTSHSYSSQKYETEFQFSVKAQSEDDLTQEINYIASTLEREENLIHIAVGTKNRKPVIVQMLLEHTPEPAKMLSALKTIHQSLEQKAINEEQSAGAPPQLQRLVGRSKRSSDHRLDCMQFEVNLTDCHGRTALHVISNCSETTATTTAIAEALFKKKINVTKRDCFGWTALHYAAFHNQLDIVDMFISVHANLETRIFVKSEHEESELADTTVQGTSKSRTALHLAASKGYWQIVASLMKAGAQFDVLDERGLTPLALAMLGKIAAKSELRSAETLGHAVTHLQKAGLKRREDESDEKERAEADEKESKRLVKRVQQVAFARPHETDTGIEMADLSHARTDDAKADTDTSELAASTQRLSINEDSSRVDLHRSVSGDSAASESKRKHSIHVGVPPTVERPSVDEAASVQVKKRSLSRARWAAARDVLAGPRHIERRKARITESIENFDLTINQLLTGGASIAVATEACAHDLEQLMDVAEAWTELNNTIRTIEEKLQRIQQEAVQAPTKDERDEKLKRRIVFLQKREDQFMDKTNQIVIAHVYKELLRPKHRLRLFRYMIFLLLLTLLGIYESARSATSAHFLYKALVDSLVSDEYDYAISKLPRNFEGVDSIDEFWMWTRGPMLENVYQENRTFWEGSTLMPRGDAFLNSQNRIIGVPRLRQIRSEVVTCDVPDSFDSILPVCFDGVRFSEDTQPYGPNGQWLWSSRSDLKGVWNWGRTAWYDGSGYVVELPPVTDASTFKPQALALLEHLDNNKWIDAKTRVVFFEMAVYNANENHFVYCTVQIELPLTGGIVPSFQFEVVKLRKYMSNSDWGILVLEILTVINFLLHLSAERVRVKAIGLFSYTFGSLYNLMDVVLCIILTVAIAFHIVTVAWAADIDWDNTTSFQPLGRIALWTSLETDFISVVVLLAWLKLLDYLSVFQKISRLVVMIEMMLRQLLSFLVIFLVVLAAFASAVYIAYGYEESDGFTWLLGLIAALSNVFNTPDLTATATSSHRVLGTIYSMLFTLFMSLMLLNLIIAIMSTAYELALTESGDSYWATRQYQMLTEELRADALTEYLIDTYSASYSKALEKVTSYFDNMLIRHFPERPGEQVDFQKEKREKAERVRRKTKAKRPSISPLDGIEE